MSYSDTAQRSNPPTIHTPAPTYSHISSILISNTARLITIAGQVGIHADGTIAPDFRSQVSLALDNLSKCLDHAGCTKEQIVQMKLYIVGKPGERKDEEEARKELVMGFWGKQVPPPDTLVFVAGLALPELRFEVEAVAVARL